MSQEQLEPRRQLQNIQKTIKKKTIEGNKSAHTKFDKFLKYVEDNEDRKFGIQSIIDLTNELYAAKKYLVNSVTGCFM